MLLAFIALIFSAYFSFETTTDLYALGLGLSGIVVLITIFLFKNRPLQVKLNYLVILLILILSGLSFYRSGIVSGERSLSEKDIEWLIPLVSIVFLLTANKYIKRDEALVKSIDRIR